MESGNLTEIILPRIMAIVLNFVRSICGFLFLLLFFKIHETTSLQRLNTPENTPCAWHSSPIQNGGRKVGVVLERVYYVITLSGLFGSTFLFNYLLLTVSELFGSTCLLSYYFFTEIVNKNVVYSYNERIIQQASVLLFHGTIAHFQTTTLVLRDYP